MRTDLGEKETPSYLPRKLISRHLGVKKAMAGGYNGKRVRSGAGTGQPDWFRRMKRDAELGKHLSKIPLSVLIDEGITNFKFVEAMAMVSIRNVAEFAAADIETLLSAPGVGPKTLAKLRQDLAIKHGVKMKWKVPA